jgi:O-antigen/teichoic acid export membrane protein
MVAERTAVVKDSSAGAGSAILYLAGSVLQGLGLLLIQPFAIRLLSPVEWGFVSTSVVAIQVVVVLISAGLPLAITRLWFEPSDGQRRARAMYGFLGGGAAILGILMAAVVAFVSLVAGASVAWPAVMAMVSIGFLGSVLGAQAVLRAQNRPLAFVALSLVSSVVANLAGLGAILLTTASATAYLVAYTAAVAAAAAMSVLMVRPKAPWRVQHALRESVGIAVPLLPHTGALMLLTQGAVLLLAALAGAAPAGQYGAVLIFALGPLTLLNALNNAWATRLMEASPAKLPTLLRSVAAEALLASAAIGILASAAATAGGFILTQAPEHLGPVARVLPLASSGYALFLVATNVVYILKRTRIMAYVTPLVVVLMAAVAVPFALNGDLIVVAAVQAGGFVLLGLAYWLVVRKSTRDAWPIRLFLALLCVHLMAAIILGLLPTTFLAGVVEVAVTGLLLAAAAYVRVKSR